MYKLGIILLFLSVTLTAKAQQENYNAEVDKKTYGLYMKSEWNELQEAGETAIDSGIDFYYLRMRLGTSFYLNENYMSAISHFERALTFQPKDTVAMEYLYYSYLFSGRKAEANLLSNKFTSSFKRRVMYDSPEFFTGAYSEAGYSFNNNYNSTKENNILVNNVVSGTRNVYRSETYLNVSLIHSVGDRVSIFHGYNNIAVNSLRQFDDLLGGKQEFDASVKQNEYYFNIGIYLGKGYNLTTAIHYLNVRSEDFTPPLLLGQPFINTTSTSNALVETIGILKRIGQTELGYSALLSNLNGGKQMQNTFTIIWYPLGNMNLYNVSNLVLHSSKDSDSSNNITKFIFDEKVGFKVSNKLWIETVLTAGNIFNYSEGSAFIVIQTLLNIKQGST